MTRERALGLIETAFATTPRPPNDELLHPDCADDMDLEAIYPIAHWHDITDDDVIGCYASLAFLSPDGFRHFIPAYMSYCLRNPESPEAVVSSTVWAFLPTIYSEDLRAFVGSKFSTLDEAQRAAVEVFLKAMVPFEPDAERALGYWRQHNS